MVRVFADGRFSREGFSAGTYRVHLEAGESVRLSHTGKVVLSDRDVVDLVLKKFADAGWN